jgi:hypothetical protein
MKSALALNVRFSKPLGNSGEEVTTEHNLPHKGVATYFGIRRRARTGVAWACVFVAEEKDCMAIGSATGTCKCTKVGT